MMNKHSVFLMMLTRIRTQTLEVWATILEHIPLHHPNSLISLIKDPVSLLPLIIIPLLIILKSITQTIISFPITLSTRHVSSKPSHQELDRTSGPTQWDKLTSQDSNLTGILLVLCVKFQ